MVVSITICCPEWSDIKYTWMPSPVYQNMVNLIMGFPFGDVQVHWWMLQRGNIVLLTMRFLDVTTFTTLTPLSLQMWCTLSFLIVNLKTSSVPTLVLKSPNRIFMWYLGNVLNIHFNCSKKLSLWSIFILFWAWTFRTKIWNEWRLSIIYDILSLTHSTL
jgi:hypothetical protein